MFLSFDLSFCLLKHTGCMFSTLLAVMVFSCFRTVRASFVLEETLEHFAVCLFAESMYRKANFFRKYDIFYHADCASFELVMR